MGKKALKKIRSSLVIVSLVAAISLIYNQDTVFTSEFPMVQDCTVETDAKIAAKANALKNLLFAIYYSRVDTEYISPDETILNLPETLVPPGAQEIGCDQYEDGRIEVTMAIDYEGRTIMAKGYGYPRRIREAPSVKHFPPVVFIQTPKLPEFSTRKDSILIRAVAKAVNPNVPITDIHISHNGNRVEDVKYRNIDIVKRNKAEEKMGKKWDEAVIEATVPLHKGINIIEVVAYNNFKKSEPKTIKINMKPETHESNLYVLSIGISEYERNPCVCVKKPPRPCPKCGDYNLDYAHKDAKDIFNSISGKNCKNYKSITKKLLIDGDAKRSDILDGLVWLRKQEHLKKEDTVVIYLSGHGVKDIMKNNVEIYYFLPHDGDHEKLRQTAVNWHEFIEELSLLPSKTVLFVDTCHSSGIIGQQALVCSGGNVVVIAASIADDKIIEFPKFEHSALAQALIEGLEGKADLIDNGKGNINLKELDLYVSYRVKKLTKKIQKTTFYSPGASVDYCLFKMKN